MRRKRSRSPKETKAQFYPYDRVCQALALALGLLLLAGCSAQREETRRRSQTMYQLGIAHLTEGDPSKALARLTEAETLSPEDPEIPYALGLAYWARRDLGLAEQKFRRATELKPDYSEAWNNLGALYMDKGDFEAAVPPLRRALSNVFYETRELALANLGLALMKTGRVEESERVLREAIGAAPRFALAHKFLGVLLQRQSRHEEALVELDRAVELLPADQLNHLSEVHLERGLALWKLGDRPRAREAFDTAWRLAPASETGRSAKNFLGRLE